MPLNEHGPKVAVRVATRLPDELHQRLAKAVRERGCSASDVVRDALERHLPPVDTSATTAPPDDG